MYVTFSTYRIISLIGCFIDLYQSIIYLLVYSYYINQQQRDNIMYSVMYNKNSGGYSAFYEHDGEYIGMTDIYNTLEELQAVVTIQMKAWVK